MIIGLTGLQKAGKKTLADILVHRYRYAYLSITRDPETGKALNLESIAKTCSIGLNTDFVICSFRSIDELDLFRDNPIFALVNVEAGVRERMSRSINLSEIGLNDLHKLYFLLEEDALLLNGAYSATNKPTGVSALLGKCQATLYNNGNKEDLENQFNNQRLAYPLTTSYSTAKGFMKIAETAASWSECLKGKAGCVIAREKSIISLGYNNMPGKFDPCLAGGCKSCKADASGSCDEHVCVCLHAEQDAILSAKQDIRGATLYTTRFPCNMCLISIIKSGIGKVVYGDDVHLDSSTLNCLIESGTKFQSFQN